MLMAFDEVKATQAAALFLRLAGKPLEYMALIKLLYRADREALRRWGLPITTDKYVSMKLGPVTSNIYNLIKASACQGSPTFWSTHIAKTADPYYVEAQLDPGNSELSPIEESLIEEIFLIDGKKGGFQLADECHRDFPEWEDPGGSSTPIEISAVLEQLDLTEDEISHSERSVAAQRASRDLAA